MGPVVREEDMHRGHQRKTLMAMWASSLRGLQGDSPPSSSALLSLRRHLADTPFKAVNPDSCVSNITHKQLRAEAEKAVQRQKTM